MDKLKTHIKLGKKTYWLSERSANDVFVIEKFSKTAEFKRAYKNDEEKGIALSTIILAQYFNSYYKDIPFYKVFSKIKYKVLSNYKVLRNYFPLSIIERLLIAGNHLEKQVKKKMSLKYS